ARMKNLHFALKSLNGLKGDVVFDIYGPIEDAGYWKKCQNSIDSLPTNIQVSYRGQLDHRQVAKTLPLYDLFYLPTLGENFGHIIFEALSAGLPVLISDQTPWLHLETQRAGWDLSLEDQEAFTRVLQACVDMSSEKQDELSKAAVTYVNHYWETSNGYISNKLLFDGGAA
ncbi:MAG: glycosyltransferase, partial [Coxiellaceae bacterium]|nr:glycosyltransferase [Coxiellaceae bacterium]